MADLARADVLIVGGGWTGLLMAKEIASRTALSVVVLERGGPVRTSAERAAEMDELDYGIRLHNLQNLADATVTHRYSDGDRAVPVRSHGPFHPGTGVGGSGELWAAVTFRFLPEMFVMATHLREKYGAARLPENLAVQDWGITYDDLEPYYWRAEQLMGSCGKAGNLSGKLIDGGNIFEAPRLHEYPNPPHPLTYAPNLFREAALRLGYHPFPIPAVTLSQTYRNPDGVTRPGCTYCGYCADYHCMIGAKASPSNTLLPVLAKQNNFTLRTGCWVRRVIHRNGKAVGVSYVDGSGKEVMQPADVVVLAAWTPNNTRLLLLSGIGDPYNAATGKGTLGKNLTHQAHSTLQMFLDKPLNSFMNAGGMGTAIGDFTAGPPESDTSSDIYCGGPIQAMAGGPGRIASFSRVPPGEVNSDWGSEWKKAALKWQDRTALLTSIDAHLSYRQNYMDLDPTYTDKFGDPLLRMTLDWTDHERREVAMISRIQLALAKEMGAKSVRVIEEVGRHYSPDHYQGTHLQGGAIMGDSPERSVVNTWLQHWRMPNLWVVGGSSFPQNESEPTLTAVAVTTRAADAFVDRYVKRPGALA